LCNYPGWLLTQHDHAELNNADNENMGALYGLSVPLKAFALKHWDECRWDPAWKDVDWVVMADPVTTGANVNTLSGISGKTYNCEFHVNPHASMKLLTKDGRYSVLSDTVSLHWQAARKAKIASTSGGTELFVAYDNVIKEKKQILNKL
jgi:hypothetical protein